MAFFLNVPCGSLLLQTIEKMTVDRMKKRHGNINNEILMEKRVGPLLSSTTTTSLFISFYLPSLCLHRPCTAWTTPVS